MQSFLRNNLSAEFPFDTSPEEIEVIKHDCTGTLILGRAGSGKTTVLVHKLLRNFMAQKSIIGQRPVRQILLTRSPILAKKLEIYTKRLVESQLLKMPSAKASEDLQDFVLGDENEMFAKSFCNLSEDDFPLVCTSDQLLQLIENTIRYSHD
jgi:superfamily I DNA and RNA helicase